MQVHKIALTAISPGTQPRKKRSEDHISRLAASLAHVGQLSPIGVEGKNPYVIRFGHSRVEAARRLGWETIAAFIFPPESSPGEAIRMAVSENTVREQMTFADLADVVTEYASLRGINLTQAGHELGFKQSLVSKCVSADRRLTPENKKRLLEAKIGGSIAYLISKEEDQAKQTHLVDMVFAGATRAEIERNFRTERMARIAVTLKRVHVTIEHSAASTHEEIAEALRDILALLKKHSHLPVDVLPRVLGVE